LLRNRDNARVSELSERNGSDTATGADALTSGRRGAARHRGAGGRSGGRDLPGQETRQDAADDGSPDQLDLVVAARSRPKRIGHLPRLLAESTRLAWSADRGLFVWSTVLQLIGGVLAYVQLQYIRRVLNAMSAVAAHHATVLAAMPAVAVLVGVTSFTTVSVAVLTQQQRLLAELVSRSTWQRILDVAGAVNLRAYESAAFFDRFSRVQTNALTRPFTLTQSLINLIGGGAGTIGVAAAILAINPLLLPLVVLSGLPLWWSGRAQSKREFAFAIEQTPRIRLRMYLLQVLSQRAPAKELRAFGFGAAVRQRFDDTYGEYIDGLRRHVRRRSRLAFVGSLLSAVILGSTIALLVWMVGRGTVSLTASLTAIVAIRLLGGQITSLFSSVQQIFESSLFLDDYHDFLELKTGAEQDEAGAPAPPDFSELRVENVSFTYPGSGRPALRSVSMEVRSGEVVALVGENGSGKTTLAKLLGALYEPDEGVISWDGVDTRSYDRSDLRRGIAVIFQDFVHYEMSAADNIAAGRGGDADADAIRTAARQAGADGFIEQMPRGYETILSKQFKGGRDLSLGQWQRVALARAFYRQAPFVILDEPSSALDPKAEHDLFARIRELLSGRTVLFISHRFSTVRAADRIYVMADGQVIEHGNHDELMMRGGKYAELFTLQAAAYLAPTAAE
jgi:ATP-binding cassette subfamily B protein